MKCDLKHNLTGIAMLTFAALAPAGAQTTVVRVSGGVGHTLFVKSDGSLWGMGDNSDGQLGLTNSGYVFTPQLIVASNVTAIAAGGYHSLFLKTDGSLWGMGYNVFGELGDGTTNNASKPEKILPGGVAAIATGWYHSLILNSNGSLYATGYNEYGELGDGTTNNKLLFVQIEPDSVTGISAGWDYSLFIRTNGGAVDIYGMGDNSVGELGDGTLTNQLNPERIIHYTNGSPYPAAAKVYASLGRHSLILGRDGSLWGMGVNPQGQLGLGFASADVLVPTEIMSNNVTLAATGNGVSYFVEGDGTLWGMGDDFNGAMGFVPVPGPEIVPFPIEIWPQPVTGITGGYECGLFITTDGSLWGMGDDGPANLGDGHENTSVYSPEVIVLGPPPAVSTGTYSNQTVVLYPSYYGNYHNLQMSTNPASGVWTTVSNFIDVSGVQITNMSSAAFFKLP